MIRDFTQPAGDKLYGVDFGIINAWESKLCCGVLKGLLEPHFVTSMNSKNISIRNFPLESVAILERSL